MTAGLIRMSVEDVVAEWMKANESRWKTWTQPGPTSSPLSVTRPPANELRRVARSIDEEESSMNRPFAVALLAIVAVIAGIIAVVDAMRSVVVNITRKKRE